MRVALDATYSVDSQPSGIAVYSRELMSGLARLHPEDTYLHCFRPKQFLKAGHLKSANVQLRVLLPALRTFRSDLFHALNQRVDRAMAKRVLTTFHDLFVMTGNYSTPEFRARFTEQARTAARNSDLIIAVSRFTADQVTNLLGVETSRVRVVPHGVHRAEVTPETSREKIILFVGALQVRKNVGRLASAFERLDKRDWRLVLAGAANGFGAVEILAGIERSPARPRIKITGYLPREELDALYRKASVFAFPSLDEGFGIPVLEAMAHGIPVLTSKRSATAETAGDAAILIDPENVDEIAGALDTLTASEEIRRKLGAKGLMRASAYTWGRSVRETHAIYQELCG